MKFIITFFILISNAYATFPIIDVQNISGEYSEGKGNAYAEKAYYVLPKVKISHSDIKIKINKKAKSLVINDPNTMVELDFDFSFLNVFKSLEFDNLNIKSDDKLFTFNSQTVDWFISPKNYRLTEVLFDTDVRNIPTQDDEDISVVDGLILNANFFAKKMEFSQLDTLFFKGLAAENPGMEKEISGLAIKAKNSMVPMIVRFIKFKANKGFFTGRAKIDSYINLWLKLGGNISTDKANTYLDIHLKTAKLGIFSIRGTLLRLIRELKQDNIEVKGNHIIVDLNSIVLGGSRRQ